LEHLWGTLSEALTAIANRSVPPDRTEPAESNRSSREAS